MNKILMKYIVLSLVLLQGNWGYGNLMRLKSPNTSRTSTEIATGGTSEVINCNMLLTGNEFVKHLQILLLLLQMVIEYVV